MNGYFEMWVLDSDGTPMDHPVQINTDTGVILNSHAKCDPEQVRHLCAIARQTRDYPVDISAWDRYGAHSKMIWSARIFWRSRSHAHG